MPQHCLNLTKLLRNALRTNRLAQLLTKLLLYALSTLLTCSRKLHPCCPVADRWTLFFFKSKIPVTYFAVVDVRPESY
jgi:hypothetical protein